MANYVAKLGCCLLLLTWVSLATAGPVRIHYDPNENEVLSSEHTRQINWVSSSGKLMPNRWSARSTVSPADVEGDDELQVLEEDAEFLESIPTIGPSVTTAAPNIVATGPRLYEDDNYYELRPLLQHLQKPH